MKLKLRYFIIIILVVCCSLSGVAAADNNESYLGEDGYDYAIAMENNDLDALGETSTSEDLSSPSEDLYGIVDLGSNVLSLNIFKEKNGKLEYMHTENENSVTAYYKENNRLTQEGIDQLIAYLDNFEKVMDSNGVNTRYFFATASLRNIDNGNEVVEAVKNRLGIDMHILSGEKEALVGFNAVKHVDFTGNDGLLIDLGGGSCEVTPFINKTPVSMESMPIGSMSAYSEYVSSMFPNDSEIKDIQNRVEMELGKLSVNDSSTIDDLYGLGGTLFSIKQTLIYLGYIDNETYVVPKSTLDGLLGRLLENTTETQQIINDVAPNRINTLLPGIIITKQISDHFQVKYIHFCKSQMEEGIVYELIENNTKRSDENASDSNATDDGRENASDNSYADANITENNSLNADSINNHRNTASKDHITNNNSMLLIIVAALICIVVAIEIYRKRN